MTTFIDPKTKQRYSVYKCSPRTMTGHFFEIQNQFTKEIKRVKTNKDQLFLESLVTEDGKRFKTLKI
jgi:hypothetical protein